MTDQRTDTTIEDATQFVWHPTYAGRTFESVERDLADAIRRDQQSYHLTLENAEKEEFGAFHTLRDLEKHWSDYDFGWFDVDPNVLAQRIVAFERERERRQEMISWQDWRESAPLSGTSRSQPRREGADWRENLSEEQRRKIAGAMAILIMVVFILTCVLFFFVFR